VFSATDAAPVWDGALVWDGFSELEWVFRREERENGGKANQVEACVHMDSY